MTYRANCTDDSRESVGSGETVIYINGKEHIKERVHIRDGHYCYWGGMSYSWHKIKIGSVLGSNYLKGQIDDFKMYATALNKDQVKALSKECNFGKFCRARFRQLGKSFSTFSG